MGSSKLDQEAAAWGKRSRYRLLVQRADECWHISTRVEHLSDASRQTIEDARDRALALLREENVVDVEIVEVIEVARATLTAYSSV